MKHRLTVEIEKRFKRQLSKRFNPRNARSGKNYCGEKEIRVRCLLCEKYLEDYNCSKCPFRKFEIEHQMGCMVWINEIMGVKQLKPIWINDRRICWHEYYNQEAIELLKKLREEAKKYIVWI